MEIVSISSGLNQCTVLRPVKCCEAYVFRKIICLFKARCVEASCNFDTQAAYATRGTEKQSEVVDIVKEKVEKEFGDTIHDQDAAKLVQNVHEKLNRMPVEKASTQHLDQFLQTAIERTWWLTVYTSTHCPPGAFSEVLGALNYR